MEATKSQPQPPRESVAQRYKLTWRILLISNLALGAYMFVRAKKKDAGIGDRKTVSENSSTISTAAVASEEPLLPPPTIEPKKVHEPIPDNQKRELFKWILDVKRKAEPKNPEEKKQIDEEKAILKQFIRAKSIPTF
ncbi:uncharacterized protein LOC131158271 [Malania oleifera]|uniref:uncharacterized protein LOC131158271 n=1 Tax=Malania oleifera TaxID=397392 RepID=UPI0025AE5CCA|nr:uncharacterized protein LOC131158271 [Malania oleifera]